MSGPPPALARAARSRAVLPPPTPPPRCEALSLRPCSRRGRRRAGARAGRRARAAAAAAAQPRAMALPPPALHRQTSRSSLLSRTSRTESEVSESGLLRRYYFNAAGDLGDGRGRGGWTSAAVRHYDVVPAFHHDADGTQWTNEVRSAAARGEGTRADLGRAHLLGREAEGVLRVSSLRARGYAC